MKPNIAKPAIIFLVLLGTCFPAAVFSADLGLVKMLVDQVGVKEDQAKGGAGAIFLAAKQTMGEEKFSAVEKAAPEVTSLLKAVPGVENTVSGISSKATSMVEGDGMSFLNGTFSKLGLSGETLYQFVPVVLSYLGKSGGDSTSGLLKSALPAVLSSDLVGSLTGKLGVSHEQAAGGAGAVFGLAKSSLGDDFGKISSVIPEMDGLLNAVPKSEGTSGMLSGALSSLGGNAAKAGGISLLNSTFKKLGLKSDMVGLFTPIILDYVQTKGGDVLKSLMEKGLK